jgi:hypothetical protein
MQAYPKAKAQTLTATLSPSSISSNNLWACSRIYHGSTTRTTKTQAFKLAAQEIETRKSQAENKHHSLVIMKTWEQVPVRGAGNGKPWLHTRATPGAELQADDQVDPALQKTLAQITSSNRENTGNRIVSKENLTALLPTSKKQRASVAKQILCGQEKIQHQNREINQGKILVVLRPAADSRLSGQRRKEKSWWR